MKYINSYQYIIDYNTVHWAEWAWDKYNLLKGVNSLIGSITMYTPL